MDTVIRGNRNAAWMIAVLTIAGLGACAPQPQSDTTAASSPTPTSQSPASTAPSTSTSDIPDTVEPQTPDGVRTIDILFVGNSHTATHDIPTTVASLLNSDPAYQVSTTFVGSEFLRVASQNPAVLDAIAEGSWDIVILQGQEISQSHSIEYSRSEAVALAELAAESGARPLLFSEWSRRDIDETSYIKNIYSGIAAMADAEVIPVGRAWDRLLADDPAALLWAADGNHSSAEGAFLAAATIAYFIAGPAAEMVGEPDLQPLLETARMTIAEYGDEVSIGDMGG